MFPLAGRFLFSGRCEAATQSSRLHLLILIVINSFTFRNRAALPATAAVGSRSSCPPRANRSNFQKENKTGGRD
ncbi:hypothetical protein [Methanimicrococcus hongohii]|uniref:hypothetical protein n=1 Tax=Methanimicrococcus hongohii TaxID=3028295 RepID=UPI002931A35C|nr:hypothetical protein [Methanimicrococcus sp. Hf6]